MSQVLILASESASRKAMLTAAGVPFTAMAAHVDETAILDSMWAENAKPRDIADALAELKALKVSRKAPGAFVLGGDQVLECAGRLFEKAKSVERARETLVALRGKRHRLISAAVIARDGAAIWRHADEATLTMRDFTDEFLDQYIETAGTILTSSVGAYALEGLGIQLFSQIRGDSFTIQGLPLLPVLEALRTQGVIAE
jgi:septum formation protein